MNADLRSFFAPLIDAQLDDIRNNLTKAVAHRSVYTDYPEACRASAEWVVSVFADAGVNNLTIEEAPDGSFPVFGFTPPADGCPTVVLYCHHDVQPADDQAGWESDPWTLTEKGGRWYGRGAADDKGNLVALVAALHALAQWAPHSPHPEHPFGGTGVRLVCEGSEEAGGAGLEELLESRPELFAADVILIADTGNVAVGQPTINISLRGVAGLKVSVDTLRSPVHSGQYGGPAPDALYALIHMLASIRDRSGGLTVDGIDATQTWYGVAYAPEEFASDVGVLDGVELCPAGTPSELTCARPTVTITGIDAARTDNAINAVPAHAAAMLNLRVPPGMDPSTAQQKLMDHLAAHAPWGAHVSFETEAVGQPYRADTSGWAHQAMTEALASAYDTSPEKVLLSGDGGSIPLCAALKAAHPRAQLVLFGVEEPLCGIHGPNESVDPTEIVSIARAVALFLAAAALR